MKIRFLTRSGTMYEINKDKMTWERISKTERSGKIREDSGILVEWPTITMGYPAVLMDRKVQPGCDAHGVITSPVVAIEEQRELPLEPVN